MTATNSSNGARSLAPKARQKAVSALIALHEDEFAQLYEDERESVGLPRISRSYRKLTDVEKLERRLERVQSLLSEARQRELAADSA